jgi:hypothetical protein
MCQLGLLSQLRRIFQTSRIVILSRESQEARKVRERSRYLGVDGDRSRSHLKKGERDISRDVERGIKITM